jgi:hypothetical protein
MEEQMKIQAVVPRYEKLIGTKHGSAVPKSGRFIAITNSERLLAACPKRWWFRHSERLDTEAGPAARLGTAFHEVMEDVWGWWAQEDAVYPDFALQSCIKCHALRKRAPTWAEEEDCHCSLLHQVRGPVGPIPLIAERWRADLVDCDDPIMTEEEWQAQVDTLGKMCRGYLARWGNAPPENYRVIGVELTLAAPIMDGDRPFRTNVPVVDAGDHLRMAARTDQYGPHRIKMVRWPWYQVGRIDALMQHRETGALWIVEHKTSRAPQTYFESLSIDPQTTGYLWLLRSMCERGLFGKELQEHPNPVAGYLYDVVSSATQYEPAKLKTGGFSMAKNKNTPSWIYRQAIENEPDPSIYDDHIQHLTEKIDTKLYQREWGGAGQEDMVRYALEIAGVADRHAKMRRDMMSPRSRADRLFPRQPVCMRGFCSYKGICINDTPEGRDRYVLGRVQKWVVQGVEKEEPDGTSKQVDELPF